MRIVNSAGETPKDVARRFGRLGCVAILGGDSGEYSITSQRKNTAEPTCTFNKELRYN